MSILLQIEQKKVIYTEKSPTHPTFLTDAGIIIATKRVPWNAYLSIPDNIEPDSNITRESDLHSEKYSTSRTSTDTGIMI
jgi:hypothetical protein